MRIMIRRCFIILICILSLWMNTACSPVDHEITEKDQKISIATGGTAGTYYPIGAAITAIITKYIPEVNAVAEPTSGAIANLELLKSKKVDFILAASNTAYAAYKGYEPFEEPYENIRAVAALYPEVFHFVVSKNSGMKSIYDLKGKRIAVGKENSGTFRTAKELLKDHGITFDEIIPQYLSFKEGISALQEGDVDCVIIGSGIPTAAVVDISAMMDINLLSIDKEALFKDKDVEYLNLFTIPEGTYRGVNRDIITVASSALLITDKDTDPNLVYSILEAIFKHTDEIESAHPQGSSIKLENNAREKSIPMHSGANEYYNKALNSFITK